MTDIPAEAAPEEPQFDHPLTPAERRKAILAATLGNGLEFYDFITYSFFAIQIGETFFPSQNHFLSLMASLATFGAGFLTRPLGAWILGTYADRTGRKPAMMLSMTLMGLGILMMVLTPGYATIGAAAPIIVVLARLIQGFALGGEVGSATIYMMEGVKPLNRGFSMSWQGTSQVIAASIGSAVGLLLTFLMSDAELSSYGWRIAVSLGVLIVPIALWVRNSLPETIHHKEPEAISAERMGSYRRPVICGLIVIGSLTIATYIFQYMATYGQNTLDLSSRISLGGTFMNNFIAIFTILIGGIISDRIGRKPLLLVPQFLFCLLVIPCFLWLTTQRDATSFIGANAILSFVGNFSSGALYATISESIPKRVRARAFALVYAIPVTVLGGTTQLVVTWILKVTGSPMALAYYLTVVSVIGLLGMAGFKESAPIKLARLKGTSA